jgi:hypothetical protein
VSYPALKFVDLALKFVDLVFLCIWQDRITQA